MPIIFKDDWKRYDATYDLNTPNRTFVQMARKYEAMGVENYMFMLAIVDRSLIGVDPHSPTLTQEQVMAIANECFINPWYFFREVCRAPGQSGQPARKFMANRGNMALYWCFLNHVMTLIIQARQTGKSFSTDCMLVWLMMVRCRSTAINILTKDEKLRKSNIDRIKKIMGALPSYMDQRAKNDAYNTEMVTVKAYENTLVTHLPTKDKKAADNVGRGMTSAIAVVDEPPYQPNIHIALPVALSSGGMACELAEAAGDPWGTIFTTTAGKKDTPEGKYFYDFMMDMTEWNERFLDCRDRAHLEETIKKASRAKIPEVRVAIVFNHRQLGYTDEWLKGRLSRSVSTGENADRDYFNRWTSGSAEHPLDVKTLERIVQSVREPLYIESTKIGGYLVRWHIEQHKIKSRMAQGHHLAVFDTSDANGDGDAISMRIFDVYTGELMAAATVNEANIITFAEWMATLLVDYQNLTMLIERRSTGSAVLDLLLRYLPSIGIDPFKRLFNRVVNEPSEHPTLYEEAKWPLWRRKDEDYYITIKRHFGFATSSSGVTARSSIYGQVLNSAARMVGHLVADSATISQISSLIRKNGRVDHMPGSHDDMVIGWALGHWFCMKAQNLSFYGIEAASVLQSVRVTEELTPMQKLHRNQQKRLRDRVEEIVGILRESNDTVIQARHEHELRVIFTSLEQNEEEKFSVDELIKSAKEQRQKKRVFDGSGRDRNSYASAHSSFYKRNSMAMMV